MNNILKVKKIVFEKQSFYYINNNSERIDIEYSNISSFNVKLFVEYCMRITNHSLFICIILKAGNTMSLKYCDYDITHSTTNFPVLFNIIDNSNNIPNFSYEIECTPLKNINITKALVEYYKKHHKLMPWYKHTLIAFKYASSVGKILIIALVVAGFILTCSLIAMLYMVIISGI